MKTITPIDLLPQADRFVLSGRVELILTAGENESYCAVHVNLFSAEGTFLRTMQVGFTKAEADAWGEDDAVLYDMVATKLGWTITGTVEQQPEGQPE